MIKARLFTSIKEISSASTQWIMKYLSSNNKQFDSKNYIECLSWINKKKDTKYQQISIQVHFKLIISP